MDLVTQNITTVAKYNPGVWRRLVCAENHQTADYSFFTVYMAHARTAEGRLECIMSKTGLTYVSLLLHLCWLYMSKILATNL